MSFECTCSAVFQPIPAEPLPKAPLAPGTPLAHRSPEGGGQPKGEWVQESNSPLSDLKWLRHATAHPLHVGKDGDPGQ